MKGIVGKKLGMTQVFDAETGAVTPVTVIEAGPCPVVRVKTVESDGYEAVQVAYGKVAAAAVRVRRSRRDDLAAVHNAPALGAGDFH